MRTKRRTPWRISESEGGSVSSGHWRAARPRHHAQRVSVDGVDVHDLGTSDGHVIFQLTSHNATQRDAAVPNIDSDVIVRKPGIVPQPVADIGGNLGVRSRGNAPHRKFVLDLAHPENTSGGIFSRLPFLPRLHHASEPDAAVADVRLDFVAFKGGILAPGLQKLALEFAVRPIWSVDLDPVLNSSDAADSVSQADGAVPLEQRADPAGQPDRAFFGLHLNLASRDARVTAQALADSFGDLPVGQTSFLFAAALGRKLEIS